jgi:hypothetical protein
MADLHPGDGGAKNLKYYWTKGPGLAKWASSPHPFTSLYGHLKKYMPDEEAKRVAAQWMHDTLGYWPGSDINRVAHGHPPRGKRIGKG